jgi:hypothetical protein
MLLGAILVHTKDWRAPRDVNLLVQPASEVLLCDRRRFGRLMSDFAADVIRA